MDVDESPSPVEESPVKLVVMDGVVMGPTHCAYNDCTESLKNARGGVFCEQHETLRGNLCRLRDCNNPKAPPSQTCTQHQNRWYQHAIRYGRQSLLGIRRLVRRSAEERLAWLPTLTVKYSTMMKNLQLLESERQLFCCPRFYCVETICAPCGVVIAWTKFAKAESPTNILNFLDSVYQHLNCGQTTFVLIRLVWCFELPLAMVLGTFETDIPIIVDSYHYINHRTSDYLCRKWCNPAPLNGSAPNLVVVEHDNNGNPHYKRAFNTQVCLTPPVFT